MQVRQVVGSLTFRYIAKYVVVLSASVFVLQLVFYGLYSSSYFRQLSASIVEELETLQVVYRGQSLEGVAQYIDDQRMRPSVRRFYYLVTAPDGNKVAGDLPHHPRYREFNQGWLGFQMAMLSWGKEVDVDFLARPLSLGDGYQAIVARNYQDVLERTTLVIETLFRSMIATVILGVVAGFLSASRSLAQIERLNVELSRIIRSNPQARLDTTGEKGYFREQAVIINDMLDQMESLMQGVRNVSDNIAHDLRTPLTRMRNRLSHLRASLPEQEKAQVGELLEECDDLLATFNALLRISTLEYGGQTGVDSEVQLSQLLEDVIELYEPLANDKQIQLSASIAPGQTCRGEADLLFQMFANLLDNAIKYTPEQGRISVSLGAAEPGSRHTVIFGDSGPGIPAAERKNVFRRFYRLESSRGEQPGNGLGLSLAQAIARRHGGTLELGSNNPGLRVWVDLP